MKMKKIKVENFIDDLNYRIKHYVALSAYEETSDKDLIFVLDDSKLMIKFDKNKVTYEDIRVDKTFTGEYVKYKNGHYVKYHEKEETIYDLDNCTSHNITTKEEFRVYDKKGFEQFRRTTRIEDNYFKDKDTGLVVLHEPNVFENYKEDTYLWRINKNYCIERYKKEYKYPNHTKAFIDLEYQDQCLLRDELLNDDDRDLKVGGNFYGFDKNIFYDYFQNEATIEDIKQNVRSKNYKRDIYI